MLPLCAPVEYWIIEECLSSLVPLVNQSSPGCPPICHSFNKSFRPSGQQVHQCRLSQGLTGKNLPSYLTTTYSPLTPKPGTALSPYPLFPLCVLYFFRCPLSCVVLFLFASLYERNQTGKESHSISLRPFLPPHSHWGNISLKLSLCQGSIQCVMFSLLTSLCLPSLSEQKFLSGLTSHGCVPTGCYCIESHKKYGYKKKQHCRI